MASEKRRNGVSAGFGHRISFSFRTREQETQIVWQSMLYWRQKPSVCTTRDWICERSQKYGWDRKRGYSPMSEQYQNFRDTYPLGLATELTRVCNIYSLVNISLTLEHSAISECKNLPQTGSPSWRAEWTAWKVIPEGNASWAAKNNGELVEFSPGGR